LSIVLLDVHPTESVKKERVEEYNIVNVKKAGLGMIVPLNYDSKSE